MRWERIQSKAESCVWFNNLADAPAPSSSPLRRLRECTKLDTSVVSTDLNFLEDTLREVTERATPLFERTSLSMRPEIRRLLASKPGGKGEETVAAMVAKMAGAVVEVELSVDSWEA